MTKAASWQKLLNLILGHLRANRASLTPNISIHFRKGWIIFILQKMDLRVSGLDCLTFPMEMINGSSHLVSVLNEFVWMPTPLLFFSLPKLNTSVQSCKRERLLNFWPRLTLLCCIWAYECLHHPEFRDIESQGWKRSERSPCLPPIHVKWSQSLVRHIWCGFCIWERLHPWPLLSNPVSSESPSKFHIFKASSTNLETYSSIISVLGSCWVILIF